MRTFSGTRCVLHESDCLDAMRAMPDASVDAIVTDPPYGLGFMGRAWDAPDNIAFRPAIWIEALRVLKPGGHLAAFSGTRTYHRMAVAIEDAGFEIRDQLGWLYGTGFPKSLDVAKATGDETWTGWGTALKPAWEPICLARKPLVGTVAANVLAHGTGGLNVDACRIGEGSGKPPLAYVPNYGNAVFGKGLGGGAWDDSKGRWPANVLHDGSDEVEDTFPAGASRFFYCAKASRAERAGSNHPTVKPVALMRWLCRLVTPPGGLVLDPFAGSGTTGAAAVAEGFRVTLCEREADYAAHVAKRLGLELDPF